MAEPIRVDLSGALAGFHLLLDPDGLTFGFLEDLQGDKARDVLNALSSCIVGGELPKGTDRAGLRALKHPEIIAVMEGINTAYAVPKR